jgi:hypothetical protein
MVNNPNFYGQSTTGTPNQITDGTDFPHTGIIKALSDGLGQNYAISGFNITINSATSIDVSSGVIFRDGKSISIVATPSSLTLTTTYTNGYHLLVVNSSNNIVLRAPTATETNQKVPSITTGDTIIAMITYDGANPMPIQYLTVNKTENSLSIGYNNSGYTEKGTITADANGILVTGPTDVTLDGTNDRIYVKDATDNTLKTVTPQSIADLSAYTSFNTDFDTRLATKDTDDLSEGSTNLYHTGARAISAVEGESTLDLTGALTVAGNVVFNDAGASVDFRVESDNNVNMLVVDGSQDGVGINVAAPDAELHVSGVSKTKGLVVNLVEQVAAPPPFNTYDITDEDYIILASLDPIGNNLTLNLPSASSARTGQIYRLILPVTGTGSLTIDVQSGDQLYDVTRTPVFTPYEILSQTTPTGAAGDIWEVICLSGTEWMAYKL